MPRAVDGRVRLMTGAPRILFSSHDGFGLGHTRRNARLAATVREMAPRAEITLSTGLTSNHDWLGGAGVRVQRMPSLVKDASGTYRNPTMPASEVLALRSRLFEALVEEVRPDVVVVDRHPVGVAGELRPGLLRAKRQGAAIVLGLRDVLDSPDAVRRELAGDGWAGARMLLDKVFVYGEPDLCDHVKEYGLPILPRYCGIVVDAPAPARIRRDTLVVTAGGGSDGEEVAALARGLAGSASHSETLLVRGPAAPDAAPRPETPGLREVGRVRDAAELFASSAASVQMGGYNSTYEAIAAGLRPILVPRRAPRREQAIRAGRLQHLGLADVVDVGASVEEVAWLLQQRRTLSRKAASRAGVRLDGASVAARRLLRLAGQQDAVVA